MPAQLLTAHELHAKLATKELSCHELTESAFARIDAVEERVKSFVTLTREEAMAQAARVDEKIARGEPLRPLEGIPVALKDVLCTKGIRTTCSSKILYNFVPPYDATVVERLRAEGVVVIGKTNMDEFAMGSSTENSAFFPTRNPWNLDCVPGGSSGGSAAAVAAGEAVLSLGSDTGGSIRQPASFCGVVGMKPTYGRVSRYGLIAFASSLDQIGPFARDVTDCALMLNAICGHDSRDTTSLPHEVPDFTATLREGVKGMRIGVPKEFFGQGVTREVTAAVRTALDKLCELGAVAEEMSTPNAEYGLPVYYIIALAEASSNLARYDGVQYGFRHADESDVITMLSKTRAEGFGHEVKHRIMIGTYVLSSGFYDAYYLKAAQVRTLIKRDFDRAFERYDVLVTPTAPTVAFKLGEKSDDPLAMKRADVCTIPVNIAGLPGISMPCGFADGLPIGLQFIGKALDEATILRAAYAYEQATEWHRSRPGLSG